MTLPTTTYINGVSPNPPSSEDALSPKSSTPPRDLLAQAQNPECQPPPLTIAPTHQLLSIHHTLFEEEEDEESRRDGLAERPGELIAAGECWSRRKMSTEIFISGDRTNCARPPRQSRLIDSHLYSFTDWWRKDGGQTEDFDIFAIVIVVIERKWEKEVFQRWSDRSLYLWSCRWDPSWRNRCHFHVSGWLCKAKHPSMKPAILFNRVLECRIKQLNLKRYIQILTHHESEWGELKKNEDKMNKQDHTLKSFFVMRT